MEKQGKFIVMDLAEFEAYLRDLGTEGLRIINHVQEHHTWIPAYSDFNGHDHFERLKSMEAAHLARGFEEIGQHFTTFPDGKIGVCRSLSLIPACIEGHNTGGICIENIGNFGKNKDVMNDVQKQTIIHLTALLCVKFNLKIDTEAIVYHHWFVQGTGKRDDAANKPDMTGHKTCPGTNFFGGNTVAAATANFLPQVLLAYNAYKGSAPLAAT